MPMTESRSLFHYTTAEGLIGIIRDRSLFATHAGFSNDASECTLLTPHLTKIVAAQFKELLPQALGITDPDKELFGDMTYFYEGEAEKALRAMLSSVNNVFPYYITSFCVHDRMGDEYKHGLLSQWRGYARGGFAIEFDELELDALNKEEQDRWRYLEILSNAVSYTDHEKKIDPAEFSGMGGALLRETFKLGHKIPIKAELADFGRPFLGVAPFLKHPDFREENEYRIAAMCYRPNVVEPGDTKKSKEIRFRTRPDGSVQPYIPLYHGFEINLPIRSVIVGPHPHQASQKLAVEMLFEQYGVDAEVRVSATPFRG
jgi:hypothetical protein